MTTEGHDDLTVGELDDAELVGLVSRPDLPPTFARQRLVIAPGVHRPTDAEEWAGALVMVEAGTLQVHCRSGGQQTFRTGDVIVLGWLPLQAIGNPGDVPVELLAVRRTTSPLAQMGLLRVIRHIRR